jgi:hypothetical protein
MSVSGGPEQTEHHAPTTSSGDGHGFSVGELCKRWRVGADKIHGFIRRGELVAVNLATHTSGRPMWRISAEEVRRFEQRRTSAPPPQPPRRRRQSGKVDHYPQY